MEFIMNQEILKSAADNSGSIFFQEKEVLSGIHKIAKKVMLDELAKKKLINLSEFYVSLSYPIPNFYIFRILAN